MPDAVSEIRSFNRFYTRWVGALDRHHLGSSFSLAEVRVLYELAHQPGLIARDIIARLGLDPGYLSRMLKRFEADGLVQRRRDDTDARAAALSLTPVGQALFDELDRKAAARIEQAIAPLDEQERHRLTAAMGLVARLTAKDAALRPAEVVLREPRSGDYGWAIEQRSRSGSWRLAKLPNSSATRPSKRGPQPYSVA